MAMAKKENCQELNEKQIYLSSTTGSVTYVCLLHSAPMRYSKKFQKSSLGCGLKNHSEDRQFFFQKTKTDPKKKFQEV